MTDEEKGGAASPPWSALQKKKKNDIHTNETFLCSFDKNGIFYDIKSQEKRCCFVYLLV